MIDTLLWPAAAVNGADQVDSAGDQSHLHVDLESQQIGATKQGPSGSHNLHKQTNKNRPVAAGFLISFLVDNTRQFYHVNVVTATNS